MKKSVEGKAINDGEWVLPNVEKDGASSDVKRRAYCMVGLDSILESKPTSFDR